MKTLFASIILGLSLTAVLCKYSDTTARNVLYPMSAAAYYNNASADTCVKNIFTNAQLVRKYKSGFLFDVHTAMMVVDNADRAIILAFGGSRDFPDLALIDSKPYFGNKTNFIAGGQVSSYIYKAWKALWDTGIQDDLLSVRNANPSYQVWITGHNIGGSMASLTSVYLLKLGFFSAGQIQLYTFGQPRTGDNAYAQNHDQLLGSNSFRVTHRQDPVPHIPQETDSGYIHHEIEIYYNNDMSSGQGYAECDADESSSCSDGNLIDADMGDHTHYFNIEIYNYGASGCPKSS